jgi:hypothetical protein
MTIMKNFLLLLCFLGIMPVAANAKQTNLFYLEVAEGSGSKTDDGNVSITVSLDEIYIALGYDKSCPIVNVKIRNKSANTIYVDLGNTFIIRNEEGTAYYVPSASTTTTGKSGGGSVNLGSVAGALGVGGGIGQALGGMSVGGSSSSATSQVTYSQRIIAVPPMSSKSLEGQMLFSLHSDQFFNNLVITAQVKEGVAVEINERSPFISGMQPGDKKEFFDTNSPIRFSVFVSYSTSENCEKLNNLNQSIFVNRIVAAKGGSLLGSSAARIKKSFMDEVYPGWDTKPYFVLNCL